ncbi:hypothetical protein ACNNLQ_08300 [Aerococcus urinaeequi]
MKKIYFMLLIILMIGLGGCSSKTDIGKYAGKYSKYYKTTTYSFQYTNLFDLIIRDDNTINYKELEKIVQEPEYLEKTVQISENEDIDITDSNGDIFLELTEEGKPLNVDGKFAGEYYNYNNEISQDPFYISEYSLEQIFGTIEEPRSISSQDLLYLGFFLNTEEGKVMHEMTISQDSIIFNKRPEAGSALDAEYQEQFKDKQIEDFTELMQEAGEVFDEEIPELKPIWEE